MLYNCKRIMKLFLYIFIVYAVNEGNFVKQKVQYFSSINKNALENKITKTNKQSPIKNNVITTRLFQDQQKINLPELISIDSYTQTLEINRHIQIFRKFMVTLVHKFKELEAHQDLFCQFFTKSRIRLHNCYLLLNEKYIDYHNFPLKDYEVLMQNLELFASAYESFNYTLKVLNLIKAYRSETLDILVYYKQPCVYFNKLDLMQTAIINQYKKLFIKYSGGLRVYMKIKRKFVAALKVYMACEDIETVFLKFDREKWKKKKVWMMLECIKEEQED